MTAALIRVRFSKAHGLYNAGETAGFSADKVAELEKLQVIDPVDLPEPEPQPEPAEKSKTAAKPK